MRRRPFVWAGSVALFLLIAEVGYRAVLYARLHLEGPLDYSVASDDYSRYDRAFGYVHPANGEAFVVQVAGGVPVHGWRVYSDAAGNCGRATVARRGGRRVYVFGDSFTAMQFGGKTWTHVLEEKLARRGHDVSVVNFARGGYGILQMMDLAAAKIAADAPDLALFAFISDDLDRARFWRVSSGTEENPRSLTLPQGIDTYLVDKRVSETWLAGLQRGDSILSELNGRFRKLRGEFLRRKLLAFDESFLYRRLRKGPEDVLGRHSEGRMGTGNFAADAGFRRAIETMKERHVPFAFLHLPTYGELVTGRFQSTPQQWARLRELQTFTRAPIVDFLPPTPVPEARARTLFLFPNNGHPTELGLRFYAETAVRRLEVVEKAAGVFRKGPRVTAATRSP